jgi:hypothetical protein
VHSGRMLRSYVRQYSSLERFGLCPCKWKSSFLVCYIEAGPIACDKCIYLVVHCEGAYIHQLWVQ